MPQKISSTNRLPPRQSGNLIRSRAVDVRRGSEVRITVTRKYRYYARWTDIRLDKDFLFIRITTLTGIRASSENMRSDLPESRRWKRLVEDFCGNECLMNFVQVAAAYS